MIQIMGKSKKKKGNGVPKRNNGKVKYTELTEQPNIETKRKGKQRNKSVRAPKNDDYTFRENIAG